MSAPSRRQNRQSRIPRLPVRSCSPYWTSLELFATNTRSRRHLLSLPFEGAVRLCLRSPRRTRTSDHELNTPCYPLDRGRHPLLTRQVSEQGERGAASGKIANMQPRFCGFGFMRSLSRTVSPCRRSRSMELPERCLFELPRWTRLQREKGGWSRHRLFCERYCRLWSGGSLWPTWKALNGRSTSL